MSSGAIAILFVVGTAILLERFMVDNGVRRYNRKHILSAAGFGVLALALALLLELPLDKLFKADLATVLTGQFGVGQALILAMLIGIIEESAKFFPLSIFARRKNYLSGVTEGLVLFTTVGLIFGVVETFGYMLSDGGNTGFLRLALLLFFHAALTGIAGFHFAKARFYQESYFESWLALAAVMAIHGFYDYSISSGNALILLAIFIAIAVNCYLFWLYYEANVIDSRLPVVPAQPQQPDQVEAVNTTPVQASPPQSTATQPATNSAPPPAEQPPADV